MPRASVIIATFNAAADILSAYESLAAQTMSDLEIIIVDDASEDDTVSVLRTLEWKDPRIKILVNEVNQGPSGARNSGLGLVTGDWVAILDADDTFTPDRLERLLKVGETINADIVLDNMRIIDPVSKTVMSLAVNRRKGSGFLSFVEYLAGIQADVPYDFGFMHPLINKKWLDSCRLRYRGDLRQGEDVMFILDGFMLDARIFLDVIPYYNYALNPTWRSEASTVRGAAVNRYDLLMQATAQYRARHAKRLSEQSKRLLDRRCRLLQRTATLYAFHLARHTRDFSGALRLALRHPLQLAAGIYRSKRLRSIRRSQERLFRREN